MFLGVKSMRYFKEAGIKNTDETLKLAKERAKELGIKNIIVTSTTGLSAEKAMNVFKNLNINLIVVGMQKDRFSENVQNHLKQKGHHLLFPSDFKQPIPGKIPHYANVMLRRFCEGMRAAIHIALMVVDLDLVPEREELIAIAGTGRGTSIPYEGGGGVDVAIVIAPTKSNDFFKSKVLKDDRRQIREVLCRPR